MTVTSFPTSSPDVLEAIEAGASVADAALQAGISARTVHSWIARGRAESQGAHHDFAEAVDTAWRARELPSSSGPLSEREHRLLVSTAARAGSVAAMRLYWEVIKADRKSREPAPGPLDQVDELARRRAQLLPAEDEPDLDPATAKFFGYD